MVGIRHAGPCTFCSYMIACIHCTYSSRMDIKTERWTMISPSILSLRGSSARTLVFGGCEPLYSWDYYLLLLRIFLPSFLPFATHSALVC